MNRSMWDGWAALHAVSAFYDVEGFKRGASSLKPVEREELGPVDGKSLLHLQCHLGVDTLSWARLGARVTGVDFSSRAVETARELERLKELGCDFGQGYLFAKPLPAQELVKLLARSPGWQQSAA